MALKKDGVNEAQEGLTKVNLLQEPMVNRTGFSEQYAREELGLVVACSLTIP